MYHILLLFIMVQQETACRYPALLVIFLLIFNFHTIILVILAISKHSSKEKIVRSTAKVNIDRVLDAKKDQYLSGKEIESIQNEVKVISKWKAIKSGGVASLPAGDATNAFRRLDNTLKAAGIYIVPVGELECFIKEVGGHGPEWSNAVLEQYPDLNDEVYSNIRNFIRSMNL